MTRIFLLNYLNCGNSNTLKKFISKNDYFVLNEKNVIIDTKIPLPEIKKAFKKYKKNALKNRVYGEKKAGRPRKYLVSS